MLKTGVFDGDDFVIVVYWDIKELDIKTDCAIARPVVFSSTRIGETHPSKMRSQPEKPTGGFLHESDISDKYPTLS